MSYDMAQRSLGEIWLTLQKVDAVHGLYYLLLHTLFEAFGASLEVLRWPSVVAVAGASCAVALLGRELASWSAGLVAGIVFPLLPTVQQYAQEGRSYALVCCFITWSTWLLLKAQRTPGKQTWLAYGLVLLAGCWLHEFAALVLTAHGLILAILRVGRRVLWTWLLTAACMVAALSPLVVASMGQAAQVSWIDDVSWADVAPWAEVATVGIVGRLLLRRARIPCAAWCICLSLLLAPACTLLLLSLGQNLYVVRYVLYGQPGLALLVGLAFEYSATSKSARRVIMSSIVAFGVFALAVTAPALHRPKSRSDDVQAIDQAIKGMRTQADGFVFLPSSRRAWVLYQNPEDSTFTDLALQNSPRSSNTLYGTDVTASAVEGRLMSAERILVVRDPALEKVEHSEQDTEKRRILRDRFHLCASMQVNKAHLMLYMRGECQR
ncbi:glycosyltransferase family 39 protein [Streptomyces sp. NBC_01471]|uniref:glycosyltransferase family 39 protein n=1 Tax=Streptomyces sp. NBC_01471 TaxID=2903879 RepID=UPI0032500D4D